MCVAAAIAGAGLAGGLGTAAAGNSAANAATNASNNARAQTQYGINLEQSDTDPYRKAGHSAVGSIMQLLGIQNGASGNGTLGGGNNSQIESLLSSLPGYQFNLGQGENAIANAAAGSTGISSASLTGINNYAQGAAQQAFGTELGGLQSLAGLGENAAVGTGNANASILNTGTNAETSSLTNAGNANAAGILGSTSSITNGLINGLAYGNQNPGSNGGGNSFLSSIFGGGNGGMIQSNGSGPLSSQLLPASGGGSLNLPSS